MYHKVLEELCSKYGKKYTKELVMTVNHIWSYAAESGALASGDASTRGGTDHEVCAFLVKELNLNISASRFERELDDLSRRRLPQAPLQKGVERLLNHLQDMGIPFALATNSTRRAVRAHIASKPNLFNMFHHIVCANDSDVDRGKPHPDIYLMAASKFPDRPKPMKCLVFEDSITGLEAGVAAGMQVVMIPQFRLPPQIMRRATLVLNSLQDFRPEYFGLPPFTDQTNFPKKRW